MKKELHIIPHTHWDREWYMSFEEHRYRLVELMDTLIETMEGNPDFRYYHLDGQMIVLDDYLEIKPQMRERLLRLIRDGRIQVGPWYMLQDEFLTSPEANIRNMLYGLKISRDYGIEPLMIGYFPDTFGNISQMPQILNGFGIQEAVIGRGINEMGANNTIAGQNDQIQSEMIWEGPDQSKVLGVFYVNWYHNAYELPTDRQAAKERIEQLLKTTSAFAATPYLLGMNGCDHQPVQVNLTEAIAAAQEFAGDTEIKLSCFSDYFEKIRPYRDSLKTVSGELIGKYTRGWGGLVNTASARIPLKVLNHRAQNLLEHKVEPFNLFSSLYGDTYRREFLDYSWKTLMQNHPHDSICCCSVDEIAEEMKLRFDKAMQVAGCVKKDALSYLVERIDTVSLSPQSIVVFNSEQAPVSGTVSCFVDFDEPQADRSLGMFDATGNRIKAEFEHLGRAFTYTLPKDRFRQPKFVDRYQVTFLAKEVPGFGYASYTVKPAAAQTETADTSCNLENAFIEAVVKPDGSLTVTDKETGKTYRNFHYFEDTSDKGDLYNYQRADGGAIRTTLGGKAEAVVVENNAFRKTVKVTLEIESPCQVADGKEAAETAVNRVTTYLTLTEGVARLDIKTVIDNKAEDHRIRACFDTGLNTDVVHVDGHFDVLERDILPWEKWENPVLTERMQAFFELTDGQNGVVVASKGLHEYEILKENRTMALTLLRAIGEIGDWGDFPTPQSQLLGENIAEYALLFHHGEDRAKAHQLAHTFSYDPLMALQTGCHPGELPAGHSFASVAGDFIRVTALKQREDGCGAVLRFYNSSGEAQQAVITVPAAYRQAHLCNLAEEEAEVLLLTDGRIELEVPAKKIVTISLR